ncbi:MAG: oligosaccharide flippase family protein [Candidatus Neomarinimicrobiota bacterium]|nr:oligosaccharide flippase family protein [Candidatus Neomarinimicrobiota bacterium]
MSIKILGKESLIYGTGHVLARLITFLLLPIYTHVFTPEEYGIISLVYAFMGFSLMFYRYGMDTALMKYSVQLNDNDKTAYISSIYILQLFSSIIFSGILYLIRDYVSEPILGIAKPEWIVILSGILILDNLWNHHVLLLRAENKPVFYILFNLSNVILTMIFNIVFVIKWELGIEGVLLANLMVSGIIFILSLPIIIKRIQLYQIKSNVMKDIVKFGLPFLPAGIFTMIMELSNRYILNWLEGTYAVGLFSAGYKLGILGLIVVMGFNMGWTPYFLKRIKEKDAEIEFSYVTSLFLGALGFVVIIVSLWVPEIMRLNIGSNYLIGENFWAAEKIVAIVLIGYFFFGTYVIQLPGVYAKEITTWIPVFRAIGAFTNIALNIILIPEYGVLGSAWATVVAFLFMSLSVFIKLYNKYYIKYNWAALCYAVFFMVIIFYPIHSLPSRLLIVICYVFGWYFLAINNNERSIIKRLFN